MNNTDTSSIPLSPHRLLRHASPTARLPVKGLSVARPLATGNVAIPTPTAKNAQSAPFVSRRANRLGASARPLRFAIRPVADSPLKGGTVRPCVIAYCMTQKRPTQKEALLEIAVSLRLNGGRSRQMTLADFRNLQYNRPMFPNGYKCGLCGEYGHNRRTCKIVTEAV